MVAEHPANLLAQIWPAFVDVPAARDELGLAVRDVGPAAEPVVFELEHPVAVVEGCGHLAELEQLEGSRGGHGAEDIPPRPSLRNRYDSFSPGLRLSPSSRALVS